MWVVGLRLAQETMDGRRGFGTPRSSCPANVKRWTGGRPVCGPYTNRHTRTNPQPPMNQTEAENDGRRVLKFRFRKLRMRF